MKACLILCFTLLAPAAWAGGSVHIEDLLVHAADATIDVRNCDSIDHSIWPAAGGAIYGLVRTVGHCGIVAQQGPASLPPRPADDYQMRVEVAGLAFESCLIIDSHSVTLPTGVRISRTTVQCLDASRIFAARSRR